MAQNNSLPHSSATAAKDQTTTGNFLLRRLHLNRQSSQPYYIQLQQQILALMDSGLLEQGQHLPAERVLADALQVSRSTVKRCYDGLRELQALSTHGRGGTVAQGAPRINPEMGKLKGFTEEMRELGMTPSTQVIERTILQDRTLASMFGRPAAAPFLKLVRLRLADEQPMSREIAWYDLTLAPALADWNTDGSAYTYLREVCGIILAHAEQSVEAVLSSDEEARVFNFAQPGPCLLIKRHCYSSELQLVEYVEGTFRGDAYAYRIKLQA